LTTTYKETVKDETNNGEKGHGEDSPGGQTRRVDRDMDSRWRDPESQTVRVIYIFKVTLVLTWPWEKRKPTPGPIVLRHHASQLTTRPPRVQCLQHRILCDMHYSRTDNCQYICFCTAIE
jgi:hypothetical protein